MPAADLEPCLGLGAESVMCANIQALAAPDHPLLLLRFGVQSNRSQRNISAEGVGIGEQAQLVAGPCAQRHSVGVGLGVKRELVGPGLGADRFCEVGKMNRRTAVAV